MVFVDRPLKRFALLAALSGCSLFAGWSDLQGGRAAPDAGTTPPGTPDPDDGSAPGRADASLTVIVSPDAGPDASLKDLPACRSSQGNSSCQCNDVCSVSCTSKPCVVFTTGDAVTTNQCPVGGCLFWCEGDAVCSNSCVGGGCTFHCTADTSCVNTCEGGGCTFDCAADVCTNDCTGGSCQTN